jgi:hypothetical protein
VLPKLRPAQAETKLKKLKEHKKSLDLRLTNLSQKQQQQQGSLR